LGACSKSFESLGALKLSAPSYCSLWLYDIVFLPWEGVDMIDWNRVIDTTPGFIRASVILILSGVIVLFAITIAGAIWGGQKLQAWGLTIDERHSPEAQKCAAVAGSIQYANNLNQDVLNIINSQIAANSATADHYTQIAADVNNRGGYSSVADTVRNQEKVLRAEIVELRAKQNEIIDARNKVAAALQETCGLKDKKSANSN
jgi:hypothetical protein